MLRTSKTPGDDARAIIRRVDREAGAFNLREDEAEDGVERLARSVARVLSVVLTLGLLGFCLLYLGAR